VDIVKCTEREQNADRAQVLLSIAKLSAHLAIQDRAVGEVKYTDNLFDSAVDELNSHLAVIKAQSILFELLPR